MQVKGKRWHFSQCRGRKRPAGNLGTGVNFPALLGRWDQSWWQRAGRGPAASQRSAPGGLQGPHYGVAVACSPWGQHRDCHWWGSHPAGRGAHPVVHLLAMACPAWGRSISSIALVGLGCPVLVACCACHAPQEPAEPRLSFTEGLGSRGWWLSRSVAGVVGDTADGSIGIWGGSTAGL